MNGLQNQKNQQNRQGPVATATAVMMLIYLAGSLAAFKMSEVFAGKK